MFDYRPRFDLASRSIITNVSATSPSNLGSPVPDKLPVEAIGAVL